MMSSVKFRERVSAVEELGKLLQNDALAGLRRLYFNSALSSAEEVAAFTDVLCSTKQLEYLCFGLEWDVDGAEPFEAFRSLHLSSLFVSIVSSHQAEQLCMILVQTQPTLRVHDFGANATNFACALNYLSD
jgi:hypothetical protein